MKVKCPECNAEFEQDKWEVIKFTCPKCGREIEVDSWMLAIVLSDVCERDYEKVRTYLIRNKIPYRECKLNFPVEKITPRKY